MQSTASMSGLPVSRVMSVERARSRARMRVAMSCRCLAFSTPGSFHQAYCAFLAAPTAASTSPGSASATVSMSSSVAGLRISRVPTLRLGTQAPSIRRGLGMARSYGPRERAATRGRHRLGAMKISGIVAVMAIVGLSGGPRAEAQRTGKPALLPARVATVHPRLRRLCRGRQHRRREHAPAARRADRGAPRVRPGRPRTARGDDRQRHRPLGLDHQDPHRHRGHAAARPGQALARRPGDEMGARAAAGARSLRLDGRRHHPDAALALIGFPEPDVALHPRQGPGSRSSRPAGSNWSR